MDIGFSREEMFEVLNVRLMIGGSIGILCLRRAVAIFEELAENEDQTNEQWRIDKQVPAILRRPITHDARRVRERAAAE